MSRRLPSLNALRAFEAAARHGTFVAAAQELGVTPAAISHQVKGLEEELGAALFVRRHRSVTLTRQGRALLPGLTDGLDRMAAAVAAVRPARDENAGPVVIGCGPAFAARWLVPRLDAFVATNPGTPVRVAASASGPASGEGDTDIDLTVTMLPGPVPQGAQGSRLFGESVFPVCAPRLRVGLRRASELALQTMIVDDLMEARSDCAGWAQWMEVAGVTGLTPTRKHFSSSTQALEAARRGQGVALGRPSLVCDDLRNGSLVRPFDVVVRSPGVHHVLWAADRPERPAVRQVRDWLQAEAADFRQAWPDIVE